jgi:uncharacterized protein (TIGR02466 family)
MTEVLPLFSTPLYISQDEVLDAPEVEYNRKSDSSISKSQQVLLDQRFLNHKEIVEELKHTCSWMVFHGRNDFSPIHMHCNSMFSGVLYLSCNENSGDIKFSMPLTIPTWSSSTLNPLWNVVDNNIFNSREFSYTPNSGDILIFPSHTFHEVEKNKSNINRYCLAFNYILSGMMGTETGYIKL